MVWSQNNGSQVANMSTGKIVGEKHGWDGHVNARGISIIKTFEGYSPKVYRCPAGVPTIGYGSIWDLDGKRVTMSQQKITKAQAETLLLREIHHVERAIRHLIRVPLNQNQFSALASWTFNLGSGRLQSSTLRTKINREDHDGAALEFPKWRRAGGKILQGLGKRRAVEKTLYEEMCM